MKDGLLPYLALGHGPGEVCSRCWWRPHRTRQLADRVSCRKARSWSLPLRHQLRRREGHQTEVEGVKPGQSEFSADLPGASCQACYHGSISRSAAFSGGRRVLVGSGGLNASSCSIAVR